MDDLPPKDQPDVVWIGPVGPIPIHYEDDPRFEEERAQWSEARSRLSRDRQRSAPHLARDGPGSDA